MEVALPQIPAGFETAHQEWLKLGGDNALQKYRHGRQEKFYQTSYWKLVRGAVLKRDNFCCRRCGKEAAQVHHLNYIYRGRDHFHPEVLVSICKKCHGLVECARSATSLAASYRHRLICIQEYLADNPKSASETPMKSVTRLIEYRSRLESIHKNYSDRKLFREGESEPMTFEEYQQLAIEKKNNVQKEAQSILDSWPGTDKDKSKRILEMVEEDIKKCSAFIDEVLGPLSIQ